MDQFKQASKRHLQSLPDLSLGSRYSQEDSQKEAVKTRNLWKEVYDYDFSDFDKTLNNGFFDPNVIIRAQQLADVLADGSPLLVKPRITNPDVIVTDSVSGFLMKVEVDSVSTMFMIKLRRQRHENYIHEFFIARCGTNTLRFRCPNFAMSFALLDHTLPCVEDGKVISVSDANSNHGNYLVMEHIEHDLTMYDVAKSQSFDRFLLYYIQILKSLAEAEAIKFTHYDLHGDNVLLRKIDSSLIPAYYTGTGVEYAYTDFLPVIIDFGMSSIEYEGKMYGIRDPHYAVAGIEPKYKPYFDSFKLLCYSISMAIKSGNNQFVTDALFAFQYFIAVKTVEEMIQQVRFFSRNFYSGIPSYSIDDFISTGVLVESRIGASYGGHRNYERYLRSKYPQINLMFGSVVPGKTIMNCSVSKSCLAFPLIMSRKQGRVDFFYFTERRFLPENYTQICTDFLNQIQQEYDSLYSEFESMRVWTRDKAMERLVSSICAQIKGKNQVNSSNVSELTSCVKEQLRKYSYARKFFLSKFRFELYKEHWESLVEMDQSAQSVLPYMDSMIEQMEKYDLDFSDMIGAIGSHLSIVIDYLNEIKDLPETSNELRELLKLIKKTLISDFNRPNKTTPNTISI